MTTEKILRKIMETINLNRGKDIKDLDEDKFCRVFASELHPLLFKRNPTKAISKTLVDIEICDSLNYIKVNDNAETLDEMISLTEKGSQRIETKADSFRNFIVKALIALAGAAGTVICSFIIQLIQTHL